MLMPFSRFSHFALERITSPKLSFKASGIVARVAGAEEEGQRNCVVFQLFNSSVRTGNCHYSLCISLCSKLLFIFFFFSLLEIKK